MCVVCGFFLLLEKWFNVCGMWWLVWRSVDLSISKNGQDRMVLISHPDIPRLRENDM
jgi:hypothetical protein